MTTTLEALQTLRDETTSTRENRRLTDIISLVSFQRDLYGDDFETQVINEHGQVTLKVRG